MSDDNDKIELSSAEKRILVECLDNKIREAHHMITYGLKSLRSIDTRACAYAWDNAERGVASLNELLPLYKKLIPASKIANMDQVDVSVMAIIPATGPGPMWTEEDEKWLRKGRQHE